MKSWRYYWACPAVKTRWIRVTDTLGYHFHWESKCKQAHMRPPQGTYSPGCVWGTQRLASVYCQAVIRCFRGLYYRFHSNFSTRQKSEVVLEWTYGQKQLESPMENLSVLMWKLDCIPMVLQPHFHSISWGGLYRSHSMHLIKVLYILHSFDLKQVWILIYL